MAPRSLTSSAIAVVSLQGRVRCRRERRRAANSQSLSRRSRGYSRTSDWDSMLGRYRIFFSSPRIGAVPATRASRYRMVIRRSGDPHDPADLAHADRVESRRGHHYSAFP